MNANGGNHIKQINPVTERQKCVFSHLWFTDFYTIT